MKLRFTQLRLLLPSLAFAGLGAVQLGAVQAPASPPPAAVVNVQAPPAPSESPSPEPQPRIFVSADGLTVYLIGTIADDSFKRFDAVMLGAPKARTLYLASPGGLTIEARLISALVRKRKLNTYAETYCASACTQIFVAGRERVIGKDAQLGFHQAVAVDSRGRTGRVNKATERELTPTLVTDVNGNDTLRLAYEMAGIDKDFIGKVVTRDHADMWYPTVAELTDAKVITRLAEAPEYPLPEGSISKDALRAQLVSRPIWSKGEALFRDKFELAFMDTWRLANSGTALEIAISSGRGELVLAMMTRFAQSEDSLIDRHLSLYAAEARRQATKGYPSCTSRLDDEATSLDPSE